MREGGNERGREGREGGREIAISPSSPASRIIRTLSHKGLSMTPVSF